MKKIRCVPICVFLLFLLASPHLNAAQNNQEIERLTRDIDGLVNQLDKIKIELTAVEKRYESLESEYENKRKARERIDSDISQKTDVLNSLEAGVGERALEEEIAKVTTELNNIYDKLYRAEKDKDKAALQKEKDELANRYRELNEKYNNLRKHKKVTREDLAQLYRDALGAFDAEREVRLNMIKTENEKYAAMSRQEQLFEELQAKRVELANLTGLAGPPYLQRLVVHCAGQYVYEGHWEEFDKEIKNIEKKIEKRLVARKELINEKDRLIEHLNSIQRTREEAYQDLDRFIEEYISHVYKSAIIISVFDVSKTILELYATGGASGFTNLKQLLIENIKTWGPHIRDKMKMVEYYFGSEEPSFNVALSAISNVKIREAAEVAMEDGLKGFWKFSDDNFEEVLILGGESYAHGGTDPKILTELGKTAALWAIRERFVIQPLKEDEEALMDGIIRSNLLISTTYRARRYCKGQIDYVNRVIGEEEQLIQEDSQELERLKQNRKLALYKDNVLKVKEGDKVQFEMAFSEKIAPSPEVYFAGVKVGIVSGAKEGSDFWMATIDTGQIRSQGDSEVVNVSAVDYIGRRLDANPATKAIYILLEKGWEGYEKDSPDATHRIKLKEEKKEEERTEAEQHIKATKRHTTLDGLWQTYDAIVRITQTGSSVRAVYVSGPTGRTNCKVGDISFRGTLVGNRLTGEICSWKLRKVAPDDTGDWSDLILEVSGDYNYMNGKWLVPTYHVSTGKTFPRDRWTWEKISYSRIEEEAK